MSEAAEDQGWHRQPREDDEARRLRAQSPRWCALCESWGNHHTDGHEDDDLAGDVEALAAIAEARRLTKGTQ